MATVTATVSRYLDAVAVRVTLDPLLAVTAGVSHSTHGSPCVSELYRVPVRRTLDSMMWFGLCRGSLPHGFFSSDYILFTVHTYLLADQSITIYSRNDATIMLLTYGVACPPLSVDFT